MMNSSTRKQTIYYFNDHLAMKALKHISFVVIHCNMAMQSTHLIQQSSFEVKLFFLLSSSGDSQSYQLLLYNVQQDSC